MAALRAGPVAAGDVAAVAGWPYEPRRAERVARGLVEDGLGATGPDGASRRLP